MSIDTKSFIKILNYLQDQAHEKTIVEQGLSNAIARQYIPRLYSTTVLDQDPNSYELQLTDKLRSFFKIDAVDERWNFILSKAFAQLSDEAISHLPRKTQKEVYRFKASCGQLDAPMSRAQQEVEKLVRKYDGERSPRSSNDWFEDPEALQGLSFLNNLPPAAPEGFSSDLLRSLVDSSTLPKDLQNFIVYLKSFQPGYLTQEQLQQLQNLSASLEQGIDHRRDLQQIIVQGKSSLPAERAAANAELISLADVMAAHLRHLEPGQRYLFMGGTAQVSPTLNTQSSTDHDFQMMQKILDCENPEELVKEIMNLLPPGLSAQALAAMLPEEARGQIKGILRDGLMQHFFKRFTESLTEGQPCHRRILWAPIEHGRQYIEGSLSQYCTWMSQQATQMLAATFQPDLLESIRLALLNQENNSEQLIKQTLKTFLEQHVASLRDEVSRMVYGLLAMLPPQMEDLMRTSGIGSFGKPAQHIWFEFEKQADSTFAVEMFGAPYKVCNVEGSKLDRDHLLSLLHYSVLPSWRQGASFKKSDIEKGFLASLRGASVPIQAITVDNSNPQHTLTAFSKSRMGIIQGSREDKLYDFGLLQKGIRDLWTLVVNQPDYLQKYPKVQRDLRNASEALTAQALELFEQGRLISVDQLKSVYASSKLISLKLESCERLSFVTKKRSIALPPELLSHIHALIGSAQGSHAALQAIKQLLVDALGEDIGVTIDQFIEDLAPGIPEAPPPANPAPPPQDFKSWISEHAYLHFGLTPQLIQNPTLFNIAYCVTRVALFVLLPTAAIALSVTIIACRALSNLTAWYYPDLISKLHLMKKRALIFMTARYFLNAQQLSYYRKVVNLWQTRLTRSGKISFEETAPSIPVTTRTVLKWMEPTASRKIDIPVTPQTPASPATPDSTQTEIDAKHIVETTGSWIRAADKILASEWRYPSISFLNERMRLLPVPSAKGRDIWTTLSDDEARLCIDNLTELCIRLYNALRRCPDHSRETRQRAFINMNCCVAIIDKLARRFPETCLDGFTIYSGALAIWPRTAYFQLLDYKPRGPNLHSYRERLFQLQAYHGIDREKDYTQSEINEHFKNGLFFDFRFFSSKTTEITNSKCGGEADTLHYKALMRRDDVMQRMQAHGVQPKASNFEKFSLLYADFRMPNTYPGKERHTLPRTFRQLRIAHTICNLTLVHEQLPDIDTHASDNFVVDVSKPRSTFISKRLDASNSLPGKIVKGILGRVSKKAKPVLGQDAEFPSAVWDRHTLMSIISDSNKNAWGIRIRGLSPDTIQVSKYSVINSNSYFIDSTILAINKFMHENKRPVHSIVNEASIFSAAPGLNPNLPNLPQKVFNTLNEMGERLFGIANATKNRIASLPCESRRVIEMTRSDESDQIVKTISFFTQNPQLLQSKRLVVLLSILLAHEHVLYRQLKAYPDFSRTLGEFFSSVIAYANTKSPIAHHPHNMEAFVSLFIVGIYTKISTEVILPDGGTHFPDFRSLLLELDLLKKYRFLLVLPYLHIDPNTASANTKAQAIHDICLAIPLLIPQMHMDLINLCKEVHNFWLPTIEQVLNENTAERDALLTQIASSTDNRVPKGAQLTWKGQFPIFYSGQLTLNIYSTKPIAFTDDSELTAIQSKLQTIYGDDFADKYQISPPVRGIYTITDSSGNVALEIELRETAFDSDRFTQKLVFKMPKDGKIYRWVEPEVELEAGDNITYWLEEEQDQGHSQLLVLEKGELKSIRSVVRHPGDQDLLRPQEFDISPPPTIINGTPCEKAQLETEEHGLGALSWFQPLSTIEAYRSIQAPHVWKQIRFIALNLAFNVQEDKGVMRAFNEEGDYIAPNQRQHDKWPALLNHSKYLLLENSSGDLQVLIPTDGIHSKLVALLTKQFSGITVPPLWQAQLDTILNPAANGQHKHTYFTYNFDEKGRLVSKDPNAVLHLLCSHLEELASSSTQIELVLFYLDLFENLSLQKPLSKEAFLLCTKIEMCAVLANNNDFTRLALRLAAIRAENRWNFSQTQDEEFSLKNPIHLLTWLTTQWNFQHFNSKNRLNVISFNEYQEYSLLLSVVETAKKSLRLCMGTNKESSDTDIFKLDREKIIERFGLDAIAQTFLIPPSMRQRYEFLKCKYASSDARHAQSPAISLEEMNHLEELWARLTAEKPSYAFDTGFLCDLDDASLNDWVRTPINLSEITPRDIQSHFFTYYRLAKQEYPQDCRGNQEKTKLFEERSLRFRETLLLMSSGKQWGDQTDTIVACLHAASTASVVRALSFPSAKDCIASIRKYQELCDREEEMEKQCSSLATEEENDRTWDAYETACNEARKSRDSLLKGIADACQSSFISTVKDISTVLSLAFNVARIGNRVANAAVPLLTTPEVAAERHTLTISLHVGMAPLEATAQQLLSALDTTLEQSILSLRDEHLTPIEEELKEEYAHRRVGPLQPPNDDPATVKRYEQVNADLEYYYQHPYVAPEKYAVKGLKNFYQLTSQLQKVAKDLKKHLDDVENDIMRFAKPKHDKDEPAEILIPSLLREASKAKRRNANDAFHELVRALTDSDGELLSLTHLKPEQLPELKLRLLEYLIKATRLQQIQRVLMKLGKIDKLPHNDPDIPVLIEELTFELSRTRAYKLHHPNHTEDAPQVPARFIAGYLLFEYGSNMMIWESQLTQLQKQLLGHFKHRNICTEQRTGSGKTAVGNPLTGTLLSNRKQLVWHIFLDTLVHTNTDDIAQSLGNGFNKKTHVISHDRSKHLEDTHLEAGTMKLVRVQHLGDNVGSNKKTPQSFELGFVEALDLYSKELSKKLEQLLLSYAYQLDYIQTHVIVNLDELNQLEKPSEELNHPLHNGNDKITLEDSENNLLKNFVHLLFDDPELKRLDNLRNKLQPKLAKEVYDNQIKPRLAKLLSEELSYLFDITPEQGPAFVRYLSDPYAPIPSFVATSKKRSIIGLARGLVQTHYPETRKQKINSASGYGIGEKGYAVPFIGNNVPSKAATYRNRFEAGLKTYLAYGFAGLNAEQSLALLSAMHKRAESEAQEKHLPKESTDAAAAFYNWCEKYFKEKYPGVQPLPCRLSDFTMPLSDSKLNDLVAAFKTSSAAPLEYAYLDPTGKIECFQSNMCSNSPNAVSMFAGNVGGTASINEEETFFRGTKTLAAPGTTGAYLDHSVNSSMRPGSIIEINASNSEEALTQTLQSFMNRQVGGSYIIDTGDLFNGLSSETVARKMMAHIIQEELDFKGVVYFSEGVQLILQRPDTEDKRLALQQVPSIKPKALKSSKIPPKLRAGYFGDADTVGQDLTMDQEAIGGETFNQRTTAERNQQGGGRMRKFKHGGKQQLKTIINRDTRVLISPQPLATREPLVPFLQNNEAQPKGYNNYLSAHQQISDVTRRTALKAIIKTIITSGPQAMLPLFKKFRSLLITETEKDPFALYGYPKVDATPKDILDAAKNTQYQFLHESGLLPEAELKELWETQYAPLGQGNYPRLVTATKRENGVQHVHSDTGLTQEVVQVAEQQKDQNVNQDNLVSQELQQDQNMRMENESTNASRRQGITETVAWQKADYFKDCSWLKFNPATADVKQNTARFYTVKDSLQHLAIPELKAVANAFEGNMWWTNNSMGILKSGKLAPPGHKYRHPISTILVLHLTKQDGTVYISTGAIDPNEAAEWRKRFEGDRNAGPETRNPRLKIGLFDLGLLAVTGSGFNKLTTEELLANEQFSLTAIKWKFLAGQVNVRFNRTNTVEFDSRQYKQLKKWIDDNQREKMKAAFLSIYRHRGIGPLPGSDMEYLYVSSPQRLLMDRGQ